MAFKDPKKEKEYKRKWYKANRKKVLTRMKAWYKANREHALSYQKTYREANPDRVSASKRNSYESNREQYLLTSKAWYEANYERARATRKAWSEAHPEFVCEYSRRRRAKEKNATVPMTPKERQMMLVLERTRKRLQKKTGREHEIDHIVPIDHGGIHHPCNLRVLDASANSSKRNKITPEALTLVAENYRLYRERSGVKKAEWFRRKISKAIGAKTANRLIGRKAMGE